MSILNVEHLSHGFGDRAIFTDVSFRLLKGEHIGLVGANGEGKSTFMNIITGSLMPDEGKIEWAKNVRVGYLDQHAVLEKGMTIGSVLASAFDFLYQQEERMNEICTKMGDADEAQMEQYMEELGVIQDMLTMHDFYMIDAKVEEVARALGLLDLGLDRDVCELSGGQRTKVLLGKLLLEKPDILLLDEPTNYLDAEHIAWLKRYLQEYENAFILISHDIPFLNSVVNLIYHMDNQQLNRYVGDYDKFIEVYEVKKAQLEAAYNRQQKEIAQLKDFVARNKARVATRNMAMSRQKKLDKMDMIELASEKPKPEFHFKEARTPGRYIFTTKQLVIGYDEPLSKPLDLEMERGSKIVLTGANGIGKTTLLKSILGLIPPISGEVEQGDYLEIGYFEHAIAAASSQAPSIVLLDLGLPDMDGVKVVESVRAWSGMPIIVVSARSEDADKIRALDAGADDYLTKPFSVEELLARIRTTLRRLSYAQAGGVVSEGSFDTGELHIDFDAGIATMDGEELHLTPIEYKLLCLLAHNADKVLTHQFILHEIWGTATKSDLASLRVFMGTLRKKIESDPAHPHYIQTHVGIGYRLVTQG